MPAVALDSQGGIDDVGAVAGSEGSGLDALDLNTIEDNDIVRQGLAVVAKFDELDAGEGIDLLFGNIAAIVVTGGLVHRLDEGIFNRAVHRFEA